VRRLRGADDGVGRTWGDLRHRPGLRILPACGVDNRRVVDGSRTVTICGGPSNGPCFRQGRAPPPRESELWTARTTRVTLWGESLTEVIGHLRLGGDPGRPDASGRLHGHSGLSGDLIDGVRGPDYIGLPLDEPTSLLGSGKPGADSAGPNRIWRPDRPGGATDMTFPTWTLPQGIGLRPFGVVSPSSPRA
jgi:hypothetical protein